MLPHLGLLLGLPLRLPRQAAGRGPARGWIGHQGDPLPPQGAAVDRLPVDHPGPARLLLGRGHRPLPGGGLLPAAGLPVVRTHALLCARALGAGPDLELSLVRAGLHRGRAGGGGGAHKEGRGVTGLPVSRERPHAAGVHLAMAGHHPHPAAGAGLEVHPHAVPGHHVAAAEGAPAAVVLGHDVRVRRRQHAAAARDLPGVGAAARPAAVHHDPGEQGRDAAVHLLSGLPALPRLGPRLLPQAPAGLPGRPAQHELPRRPAAPLLAPLHHLVARPLAGAVRLAVPHLLRHLRGGALVRHGLLGGARRHGLLHVQVGGGALQHGGGDRLHLLLVQRQRGPDETQDGGLLHGGAGGEHPSHWAVVRLQGPRPDRLVRRPGAVRGLPHLRRRGPGDAAVLRFPPPGHRAHAAQPRLHLLRPAAVGPPPAPLGPAHRPTHAGPHDQIADGGGRGRELPASFPGEIVASHYQSGGPAHQDRHAPEEVPGLGRSLRGQAAAEDYKHTAVHHPGRRGHPLPGRTPPVRTAAVRVLPLTHTKTKTTKRNHVHTPARHGIHVKEKITESRQWKQMDWIWAEDVTLKQY